MEKRLSGKVAIVTGSSRGIGRAIAERLAQDGATVIVNYVTNRALAEEVVAAIKSNGSSSQAVHADMSKVRDIRRMFQETLADFGKIDIVVHNPAFFQPRSLIEVTEEEFDAASALNFKGAFFVLQEAALRVQDGGKIVYISSSSTAMNVAGFAVYGGGKSASEYFAKTLAREIGIRGVSVNIVSPGFTETDMLPKDPAWRKMGADMSAFKRLGQPGEIADVVAFLVSDEARWITGQNIIADGGVAI